MYEPAYVEANAAAPARLHRPQIAEPAAPLADSDGFVVLSGDPE
jgi:hypothetical protein